MNQDINAAAKKAKVPTNKIVGPFDDRTTPTRAGLYLRKSALTGSMVWAYFNSASRRWGLYSDTKAGAMRRRDHRSKKKLPWFGQVQP